MLPNKQVKAMDLLKSELISLLTLVLLDYSGGVKNIIFIIDVSLKEWKKMFI